MPSGKRRGGRGEEGEGRGGGESRCVGACVEEAGHAYAQEAAWDVSHVIGHREVFNGRPVVLGEGGGRVTECQDG